MENLLIDNMLENAKIGIWVIELSHNKKNDPKMFGNTHMKLLLGVADSYSPEEVYQFWVERIHPAYVSYVEEAVERLISGNKAEVEYPWKHPECIYDVAGISILILHNVIDWKGIIKILVI